MKPHWRKSGYYWWSWWPQTPEFEYAHMHLGREAVGMRRMKK